MREILFRGKKESTGDWVFGDLRHYRSGKVGVHSDILRYTLLVDPETVGQYTGLADKNGVKIFEGDILEDSLEQELYTVNVGEYDQCKACFDEKEKAAYGCYTVDANGFEESIGHAHIWATVIGNIYDNPELLKEGGEE